MSRVDLLKDPKRRQRTDDMNECLFSKWQNDTNSEINADEPATCRRTHSSNQGMGDGGTRLGEITADET